MGAERPTSSPSLLVGVEEPLLILHGGPPRNHNPRQTLRGLGYGRRRGKPLLLVFFRNRAPPRPYYVILLATSEE